jgi:hypothetical protein
MIDQYGKGLIPHEEENPPQLIGMASFAGAVVNDFNEPSGIPAPPESDQGSSLSCTWHAFAKHFWQWTGIKLSVQDGYSRTHLPGGGGYLIAPFDLISTEGCYDQTQHQDPINQTEANMIVKVNLPGQKRRVFKVKRWSVPYNDINAVAIAMKQWKGIVIGVNGDNPDWISGTDPKPPGQGHPAAWGHALYCYDNKQLDQKALVASSSWCNWVKYHNIRENYFSTSNVFSPIAMEVQELHMDEQILVINYKGKVGLAFFGGLTGNILFATSIDHLKELGNIYGHPVNVDGSGNVTNIDVTIS